MTMRRRTVKRLSQPMMAFLLAAIIAIAGCSPAAPAAPTAAPAKPAAAAPTTAAAASATFPQKGKPIQWIVPFSAGGSTDVQARLVAAAMEKDLGNPVEVVDKPGAGS